MIWKQARLQQLREGELRRGSLRVMETDLSGCREQRRRERGFADRERERLQREVNSLDLESREQIEAVILEDSPTLLFVEHDRVFMESVATRIVEFSRDGALLERPVDSGR